MKKIRTETETDRRLSLRYWVMASEHYYPGEGVSDVIGTSRTFEGADNMVRDQFSEENGFGSQDFTVVDTETGTVTSYNTVNDLSA